MDPDQHVAVFTTPLDGTDPAAGVLQTLTLAGRLRSLWSVSTPRVEDDGSWSFELVASADATGQGFAIPGVRWAHLVSSARLER